MYWIGTVHFLEKFQKCLGFVFWKNEKYEYVWYDQFGRILVRNYRIVLKLPSMQAIQSGLYRADLKQKRTECKKIEEIEKTVNDTPAVTKWATSALFVPKKDGSLCGCMYFRQVNAVTVRESYHMLRMDMCINTLDEAQMFSKVDATFGYWQIEMNENDFNKITFVTQHYNFFKYMQMPILLTRRQLSFKN